MPDYVHAATSTRTGIKAIRRAHPERSIPDGADLSSIGYLPLERTDPPVPAPDEIIVPGPPEEYEPGKWCESWLTRPAPPPSVPASVTPRQARLALRAAGLLDQVPAAIVAIEDPDVRTDVEIEWEYSTAIERAHAWVDSLGTALGLDSDGLDQLFIAASAL